MNLSLNLTISTTFEECSLHKSCENCDTKGGGGGGGGEDQNGPISAYNQVPIFLSDV